MHAIFEQPYIRTYIYVLVLIAIQRVARFLRVPCQYLIPRTYVPLSFSRKDFSACHDVKSAYRDIN